MAKVKDLNKSLDLSFSNHKLLLDKEERTVRSGYIHSHPMNREIIDAINKVNEEVVNKPSALLRERFIEKYTHGSNQFVPYDKRTNKEGNTEVLNINRYDLLSMLNSRVYRDSWTAIEKILWTRDAKMITTDGDAGKPGLFANNHNGLLIPVWYLEKYVQAAKDNVVEINTYLSTSSANIGLEFKRRINEDEVDYTEFNRVNALFFSLSINNGDCIDQNSDRHKSIIRNIFGDDKIYHRRMDVRKAFNHGTVNPRAYRDAADKGTARGSKLKFDTSTFDIPGGWNKASKQTKKDTLIREIIKYSPEVFKYTSLYMVDVKHRNKYVPMFFLVEKNAEDAQIIKELLAIGKAEKIM